MTGPSAIVLGALTRAALGAPDHRRRTSGLDCWASNGVHLGYRLVVPIEPRDCLSLNSAAYGIEGVVNAISPSRRPRLSRRLRLRQSLVDSRRPVMWHRAFRTLLPGPDPSIVPGADSKGMLISLERAKYLVWKTVPQTRERGRLSNALGRQSELASHDVRVIDAQRVA